MLANALMRARGFRPAALPAPLAADQHGGGAIDDAGRIAGVVDVIDEFESPDTSWTATASKPPISPICTNDGLSEASDCIVVVGRMCSSLSRMVMPLTSFTGATEFLK